MRTLLILRHAKSSWKDPSLADHDRPLKGRGKRDAPRMARRIVDEGLVPDLVKTSTARRAHDTAVRVVDACGAGCPIEPEPDLYHGGPDRYAEVLRRVPPSAGVVLVVGHAPDVEDVLESLTGRWESLPTAALACVRLDLDDWSELALDGTAALAGVWRPREEPA
jgi:phosphohistidine phosphatase